MARVVFYGERPTGTSVSAWLADTNAAFGIFEAHVLAGIGARVHGFTTFVGMTPPEVSAYFDDRRDESEQFACLALLAAGEAVLREDFLRRVQDKEKDDVAREFREIAKAHGDRIALDRHILDTWIAKGPECKSEVGDFRGALRFRNWMAHGQYWQPKLGRQYDFATVYDIIQALAKALGIAGWPG